MGGIVIDIWVGLMRNVLSIFRNAKREKLKYQLLIAKKKKINFDESFIAFNAHFNETNHRNK